MLWHTLAYKGWLETRFRLLFALAFIGLMLVQLHSIPAKSPNGVKGIVLIGWILVASICVMLAGAGIATQPSFQATKGLHGSILFTLSLPVSRFRLLAVRAGLGFLEMSGAVAAMCSAMWFLFPLLRSATTLEEMIKHAVVLIACASGLYSIVVLMATFLDDLWRMFGSGIAFGALWWLSNHTPLPASANIFRAMGEGSPLLAHAMPWTAMAFSLELAAILFFAALKIVQTREY
jgi:hypothetical protein